ncbi:MAG: FtsK/SpoIIIE domain-containing protein [Phycisphaerales bacterium]|nr:FtsK/SpoIIIE domain-containing protein [Phycisphaerales bacterium]
MTSNSEKSPIERTIQLVTSMRETAARVKKTLLDAISDCDRQKSHATLRRREEGARLIKDSEEAVKKAKEDFRYRRRLIEDKKSHRLIRLQKQYQDREGEIDREAANAGKAASMSMENEEWMAEGVYEGRVTTARKVLSETLAQFGDIEDLISSIKSRIHRAGRKSSLGSDAIDEDIDPTQIMGQLRELDKVYTLPRFRFVMPWRWARYTLRTWKRAKQDLLLLEQFQTHAVKHMKHAQELCDRVISDATGAKSASLSGAQEHHSPSITLVEKRKQRRQEKLEANYETTSQQALDMHSTAVSDLEAEAHTLTKKLQSDHKVAMDQLANETDKQERDAGDTLDDLRSRLAMEWNEAHAQFLYEIESLTTLRQEIPLDWSDSVWQNWKASTPPRFMAPIGDFDLNIAQIMDPLSADTPFHWEGPASATLPITASLPNQISTLIEYRPDSRDAALAAARSYVLRLMTAIPPGKLRLTLLDPVSLGESFAGFMHLADADEGRLLDRIYSEERHIEEQLLDLTEHMEEVIQTYLRNEYETIDDYNRHAGQIAEPYRVLVMADFPVNLNEQATRRLLGILRSGTRCGVYVILLRDLQRPLPRDLSEQDLRENVLVLREMKDQWQIFNQNIDDIPVRLATDMPEKLSTSILQQIRDAAVDTHRVEVPFRMVKPAPEQIWTGSTCDEIKVSLGQSGANRQQYLKLGRGTSQHALVAGKTGSGKSTLMHVLITNLAMWHSPEEVEFYLVDFKKGVEFQIYASHHLPHARVIAVESDREFGLSVLQNVDEELKRRGELFREFGVQDLAGYRAASKQPLPRVLLVVDEFQELFIEDDMVTQEASLLLDRLVRQGRAFGMHALLGSQTLDGVYSLARSTMGQMGVRIALQCSEADSFLILSEDNAAARLLTRPGDAIYNDAGGKLEGNSHFQIVWLDESERDSNLSFIEQKARSENVGHCEEQFIFRGHVAAELKDCEPLWRCQATPSKPEDTPTLWLGDAVAIKPPTALGIQARTGANLMVMGQNEEAAAGILEACMLSLAAQIPPSDEPTFDILDGFGLTKGRLSKLGEALPHVTNSIHETDLTEAMVAIGNSLDKRLADPRAIHPRRFLFIAAWQSWRELRKNEDDFSFSMEDGPTSPDGILAKLLRDGPAVGLHVITWIDTLNNLNRFTDRASQREFENRVLFQMSQMDSSQIIDSPAAGKLGPNRAILHSEEQGNIEKFRPWGLSDESWLLEQARSLQS